MCEFDGKWDGFQKELIQSNSRKQEQGLKYVSNYKDYKIKINPQKLMNE